MTGGTGGAITNSNVTIYSDSTSIGSSSYIYYSQPANITVGTGGTVSNASVYGSADSVSFDRVKVPIQRIRGKVEIARNEAVKIAMPDGSIIDIDRSGNFKVVDKDAKIKYKANRVREFNRYINASDLLEEFIRFLGSLGANHGQVLNVPIEMFIKWLIFRAAQEDDEDIPQEVRSIGQNLALPAPRHNIRCNWCGKYISKDKFAVGVKFCNGVHLDRFLAKQNLVYATVMI